MAVARAVCESHEQSHKPIPREANMVSIGEFRDALVGVCAPVAVVTTPVASRTLARNTKAR